jgi:hypothetical protein
MSPNIAAQAICLIGVSHPLSIASLIRYDAASRSARALPAEEIADKL